MISRTLRADFFLLIITLIWGATFPLVTASIQWISPFFFVSLRFTLAAFFMLFWMATQLKKTTPHILFAGFILGTLNAFVYLLQTLGMQNIDADTSAFIASIGVAFVPFISPLMGLAKVRRLDSAASLLCLLGLYYLTGANLHHLQLAEGMILLASLLWAFSICYLQRVTPRIQAPDLLAFYQIAFIVPISGLMAPIHYSLVAFKPIVVFTLLYTSLLATAVVFLIQVRFQKQTTATHAAIIYSLEPVFASLFAIRINHEALTSRILIGGGIILLSILLIECAPHFKFRSRSAR